MALIQEPLLDQRSQIVRMLLPSQVLKVRRNWLTSMSGRLPMNLDNNQLTNRRCVTRSRSTRERSRELRHGAGSLCWQPRPRSYDQVPTAQLRATLMKECVAMEVNQWWTAPPKCTGRVTMPSKIATAVCVTTTNRTWLICRSLPRLGYKKKVCSHFIISMNLIITSL